MFKHKIVVPVIICITAITTLCIFFKVNAGTSTYSYGQPEVVDTILDLDGSALFLSYFKENAVVAINITSMQELTRFNIVKPMFMLMSPDGEFLYCLSRTWPDKLVRINLSDYSQISITLDGYAYNMDMDPVNEKIWIVGAVWPGEEPVGIFDTKDHPRTGRLTEIDLSNFSISCTQSIGPIPISIWYSAYSNKLYILHDERVYNMPDYENEDDWVIGNRIVVHDATTLEELTDFIGGGLGNFLEDLPPQLTSWDDDGHYLAVPIRLGGCPDRSVSIIDTTNDTIAFDIKIPCGQGATSIRFAHKQPDSDYFWAATFRGIPNGFDQQSGFPLIRINTITKDFNVFSIDGIESHVGDFAISPDGDTFYIPEIETGNMFVWSPE